MAYDFKETNIIIDDNHMVSGYGAGTPVSLAYASDAITPSVGAKGEVAIATSNDNSGTLSITLQQNSYTNRKLRSLVGKEFDMSFVDSNNESRVKGNFKDCMVQTRPAEERGQEISERQWVIFIPEIKLK